LCKRVDLERFEKIRVVLREIGLVFIIRSFWETRIHRTKQPIICGVTTRDGACRIGRLCDALALEADDERRRAGQAGVTVQEVRDGSLGDFSHASDLEAGQPAAVRAGGRTTRSGWSGLDKNIFGR
jgi:hypothetical protein